MKTRKTTAVVLLVLLFFPATVSAVYESIDEANKAIRGVGAALAVLLFSIQGLKWVTSETPQDRAEAKKGIIYIIIGLLFLKLAFHLVCGLYGAAISNFDVTCEVPAAELKCVCTPTT